MFFLTFENDRMFFISFYSENGQIFHETVQLWAAKATKIMKILYLFGNADDSRNFC